ncbi:hypothetical protein [Anaeromyxobacter oryzae]|uniref:Outer membrane protein beta-barrel domain-containing protein n=1 Tax=Anaeromyxobacter oryzae TaxID=2918170 RepID=A0ABN6MRU5_9BACT|nr:hypothetical protein [Anaeromyxobacter oryzae]BDG02128.1 hypothetical protein AMOR_11240 [Anaeromyxobacter oryzae]
MRLLVALAVLICAPLTTLAQEPPTPVAAAPRADWNLGGGLGSGLFVSYFSSIPVPSLVTELLPVVTASLERRLSGRTWLAFGVSGAFSQRRDDVPAGATGPTRADVQQLFVTAGLRGVVTGSTAPVDVSILVLAEGGSIHMDDRGLISGTETEQKTTGWLAGAELGIAVDRELTSGLSLRVATPLIAATYSEGRVETVGEPARSGTNFVARALIAPRLELRMAF